ncbi:MAG: N-6 DNA methylase, partial [Candidatus Aenigmatarchaeota archaeon]
ILNEIVEGYIHTEYWEKWVENRSLSDVLKELYQRFSKKEREIDFNSVVKAIREIVQGLHDVIRQANTEEIFEEVATKLELFTGLGEIKDKQKAKAQVSMLASYLLFNQLLFYHLYKIKTKNEKIEELKPIKSIKELKNYFSQIVEIDYQPIYAINLVDKIPEKPEIINLINDAIRNLLVIRAEHITQDLAGRFFHALLPYEVAKVWAAFYTNPIAAEILANLAIDRWDETVLDPACGSGTLLSAVYRRKLELYKEQTGKELDENTIKELHKKFLEEDIAGIDIMPFAAHLTTINLSLQKLEQPTNIVRIASMDSLELARKAISNEFKEKGVLIKPFEEEVQLTLFGSRKVLRRKKTVSPGGIGKEFYLKPVDVVIMNPPFSDREKLPKYYLEQLNKSELGKICGHQINLWGYFLALADLMLKQNGKLALVIPINIARGKATERIRNYLLENYHINFIIRSVVDDAFSESAAFRDILLIAEKRKPKKEDKTTIVLLKKSIRDTNPEIFNDIISRIKKIKENTITLDFETITVYWKDLIENRNNLMPFLSFKSIKTQEILISFFKIIQQNNKITQSIKSEMLIEGFHASPEGLSELTFITNPIDESRIKQAFLILKDKVHDKLLCKIKDTKISIQVNLDNVKPALRTITGIPTIDITNIHDFLIFTNFKDFDTVLKLSKWKGDFSWKIVREKMQDRGWYLVIPSRFRINSKNTKVISVYSNQRFYAPHTFKMVKISKEEAKIYNLILNSILFIVNFQLLGSQTTLGFTDLRESDLVEFYLLDTKKISDREKNTLLKLFEKIKNVNFPSIIEQLETRFWARVELDKTILKILGFSDKEIEEWLPKVYDAIVEELKTMKKN